ncbi:leucyl/phenylalanyl-tRNA--protein transferase [Nocardia asteroides]|uniref:leucyl/phenylalanyl-tRNA--protein transferase n=1 Tax=Nocardia asteroides TaxID=1824 RepID=UPI001E5ABC20|nr:leucyl/phenylalanyl-tRNA--protein transferase [Nocardia asteroides]UGT59637.1 leucyl/phenylalanyl-tRNA--protein transferase [Nocardia asteroides]
MTDAADLMRLYLADPDQPFPPVELADPSGLIAFGGELSPQRLLDAYASGIFPWYNPGEIIHWYCPDPRSILVPTDLRVTKSYRRAVDKADYAVTMNRAFAEVMVKCAEPRADEDGTWIGDDMLAAYLRLHRLGHAHSVEVWRDGALVGGLYGVARGRSFAGESMFSRARDMSKVALYWLCAQLTAWEFPLIDCQIASGHLVSLGAIEIPRADYLSRHARAADLPGPPGRWQFDISVPASPDHLPA